MSVAPAMTRAPPSASNPSASSRSEGRAYMRAAHASDVCMQMIERNRRLVKDRPARQRGQSPGAWAAALRKRLVPTELHHLDAGELQSAVHELMKTYVDHPPRKLQGEGYSGPITLSQFERFQWARDKLKEGGFSLPTPTGNPGARSLRAVTGAAAPLELEPLVKG